MMTATAIAALLDELVPARTAPLPGLGEPCESCGHLPGCSDDCC